MLAPGNENRNGNTTPGTVSEREQIRTWAIPCDVVFDKWKDENRKRRTPQWNFEEAQEFFSRQAKDVSKPGTVLRVLVLDARLKT